MILLPGLMYLSDELAMTFNRYTYNVQSFIVVMLVNIATKLLKFALKLGLA